MRNELTELDQVLASLETCGRTMQAAMEMLGSAPTMMLDKMQRFFPEDAPGSYLVMRFAQQQGLFSDRLKRGTCHIEELQDKLKMMFDKNTELHAAFRNRDEVYTNSSHYEKKVESLRGTAMRNSGGSNRLNEKLTRNESKRMESSQAFYQVTEEVRLQTEAVLSRKLVEAGEALSCICRYYSVAFEGADRMTRELSDMADEFSRPPLTQEVMRKGKEMMGRAANFGASARDSAANFTAGAKDRLSDASSTMSSKWHGWGGADASAGRGKDKPVAPSSPPSDRRAESFGGFGGFSTGGGNGHGDAGGGFGAAPSPWGPPPSGGSPWGSGYGGFPSGPMPAQGQGGYGSYGPGQPPAGQPPAGPPPTGSWNDGPPPTGSWNGGPPTRGGWPPPTGQGGYQASTPWGNAGRRM